MKAIFYSKTEGIVMREIEEPRIIAPDDVKIKLAYTSVCGSDLHMVKKELDVLLGEDEFRMGHESSGYVVELGPEAVAKGLKVGDKVTYYYNQHCGKCHYCRNGQEQFCSSMKVTMGSMAEYIVVNEQTVFKLPEDTDLSEAVYIEPISVCLHGIDLCRIKPGQTVAIFGGGGIGMILLQLAKIAGATSLTMIEPIDHKRETALRLGAEYVIDPGNENVLDEAMKITGGIGFDVAIEASGSTQAAQPAYDIVGRGGLLEFFAALYDYTYHFPLNLFNAFMKEITIIGGVFQSPYTFPRSIALFRRLDLKPLMQNAIFELNDYKKAFDAHINGKNIKSVLKF